MAGAVSWFIICDELANPTINFPVAKNWHDMGGDIRLSMQLVYVRKTHIWSLGHLWCAYGILLHNTLSGVIMGAIG